MITAHLPSGYILGRTKMWSGPVMMAAIFGATWPDLDLIWFFFVDERAFHHHRYWVHAPTFALACSAALIALTRASPLAIAFAAGWSLHILLDAPVGGVMWLWPFDDTLFYGWTVPATQPHWILSFVFHWSFCAELAIWLCALIMYLCRSRK